MMQPQSTLFRGPNEHVGPLKKDQCTLTPKTCPLRKALQRGEGRGEGQVTLNKPLPPHPARKSAPTSPRWGEVEQAARHCASRSAVRTPHPFHLTVAQVSTFCQTTRARSAVIRRRRPNGRQTAARVARACAHAAGVSAHESVVSHADGGRRAGKTLSTPRR